MTPIDIITLAALGGIIPALVWLWFWLREDEHPEPWQYITLVFILGMVMVPIVIPFQKAVDEYASVIILSASLLPLFKFFVWAGLEEVFKFSAAYFAALRNKVNDEPVDPIIYLIVAALGFAALENALFLAGPLSQEPSQQLIVDSVVIANLRFMGATLLHVVASATVGVFLAFSFYKSKGEKVLYLFIGLFFATLLHTLFNVVLMSQSETGGPLMAIAIAWIGAMFLMVVFEKVKTIRPKKRRDFHSDVS